MRILLTTISISVFTYIYDHMGFQLGNPKRGDDMKPSISKKFHYAAIAAALTFNSVPASAQNTGQQTLALEEIIVTARKREESLIDTPLAVSVFGKQELESAGYTDIIDISKATPGLFIEDFNQAAARVDTTPRFRGVFFSSGNRLQQTATIFLDGVYLSGGEQTIGVNELERVEIIKGPQSALFGRNTFAGAINYVTKDPSEEFRADLDVLVASEGETRVAAGIEGSIASGVTGRLSANFNRDDGDFDNVAVPGDSLGDEENFAINGTLVFKPSESSRIKVRGSYREVDDGAPAFVATNGVALHNFGGFALNNGVANLGDSLPVPPRDGTRTESLFQGTTVIPQASRIGLNADSASIDRFRNAYLGDGRLTPQAALLEYNPFNVNEFGLKLDSFRLDVHADFDLTENVALSILGGFNEESFGYWSDFDNGPDNSFMSFISQELEDKSLEVRLSGTSDKLDWSIGASYVDIDVLDVSGTASFFGPTIVFGDIFRTEPFRTGATTTGIFGSLNYRFNDQWSATIEARRQEDELRDGDLTNISPAEIDNTVPRVTIKYEPSEQTTLYATYSEGNLPGGFNPQIGTLDASQLAELAALAPDANITFGEESLINLEFGWKQSFAGGRAAFNLAAFMMEREDEIFRSIEVVTDTTPGAPNPFRTVAFTSNGASTDITGIELDGSWLVSDRLTLAGSVGYIDAEIASFPAGAGTGDFGDVFGSAANVEGQEAPRFPPFTFSLNGTYEMPINGGWNGFDSWYTRGDFFYNSKFYDSNTNTTEIDSALEANLRFGLRGERTNVELFVTNLFDEDAPTAGYNFADISFAIRTRPGGFFDFSREGTVVGLRDQRQVGVRVKYTF